MIIRNTLKLFIGISVIVFFLFLIIGCGGISKNPTDSPWKDKKEQGESGTGGKSGEEGAPEIREGASYDELIQTAKLSLEGGFIRNAADAYAKAVESQKDKPDAALSFAIIKIAGSVKEFSLLLPPGIDFFYFNTPLIGRWELLPAPMADDDSYLLRLASLGTKYLTPYSPKAKEESKPAVPPSGEGTKEGEKGAKTPGGSTVPPGSSGEKKAPGSSEEKPKPPSGESDGRGAQFFDGERQGHGLGIGPGGGDQEGSGGTGGTGATGGGQGAFQYGGGGQKLENLQLEKDIFPDLIKEYKDIARTYNSGFLNFGAINTQAADLKKIVDDIVEKLDFAKRNIDTEKFALELPFVLDDSKKGVYQVYFRSYDYDIILGYMKLIQAELNYRSAYKSDAANVSLFTKAADTNADNNLEPSEYYPPDPYGTAQDNLTESLSAVSTLISGGVDVLVKALDAFHNDDKLMDYAGNRLIPANIDQFLLDKIANERNAYSDFQVILTAGKGKREFRTNTVPVKVEVNLTNLFGEKAPKSVAALLPTLNATTLEPVPSTEGNNFPDPTWGGIFNEPFNDFNVFRSHTDITGTLTYQGEPIKDVQITLSGKEPVKSDEKGKFTIKDVDYNELIGVSVDVTAEQIKTPISAQIRSPWIVFDLMVMDQSMVPPPLSQPGGTTQTGAGGAATIGPLGGEGTDSSGGRIDEIKEKRKKEKEEKEKKESGEKGEGGEQPSAPAAG